MYHAVGFVADNDQAIKKMVGGMFVFDEYNVTKINKMNLRGEACGIRRLQP